MAALPIHSGDEFAHRGDTLLGVDGISKQPRNGIQISTVERGTDGVPHGPLHPARRAAALACHDGIELLRDAHTGLPLHHRDPQHIRSGNTVPKSEHQHFLVQQLHICGFFRDYSSILV